MNVLRNATIIVTHTLVHISLLWQPSLATEWEIRVAMRCGSHHLPCTDGKFVFPCFVHGSRQATRFCSLL